METSRATLVFSLLMCSSWTILNGSTMGEDAVPPVFHNLTSTVFISCPECRDTVKLLQENFNASSTKQDICDALKGGILNKKAGKCKSPCRQFVKDHVDDIMKGLKGKGLKDICNKTNACPHPPQA